MKKIRVLFIILSAILISCTCQKKVERLRKTCPQCFTVDTVLKTIAVPEIEFDSFFVMSLNDTVRIHDTVFHNTKPVSVWHFYKHDTVWYKVDCKPDTIRVKVADEKIKDIKPGKLAELAGSIKWIALGLTVIALIIVIILILRR